MLFSTLIPPVIRFLSFVFVPLKNLEGIMFRENLRRFSKFVAKSLLFKCEDTAQSLLAFS